MLRAALTALLPRHHARLLSSSHSSSSTIAALFSEPTPPANPTATIQSAGVDLSYPDTVPALLLDPRLSGNYPKASRFFSWAASDAVRSTRGPSTPCSSSPPRTAMPSASGPSSPP
ncbi:unnamed protein product [Urochloa humidicola]